MTASLIHHTPSAYRCPLLIRRLLESGVRRAPEQEIVYAGHRRLTYLELEKRVARLAGGLTALGIAPGDTVAVLDWDSNRYLECFFGVPMMGAVLHTINIRLSPEQILYTINHAKDDAILVNAEFLPVLESIWDRVEGNPTLVLLDDGDMPTDTTLPIVTEYEAMLAAAAEGFDFPELDENTRATTFYTTGTTGLPKGVYFSHRQLVIHTLSVAGEFGGVGHGRFNPTDVYMPITPMFHVHAWGFPYIATMIGAKQVYPGKLAPDTLLELIDREKVTFSHCVPTILRMVMSHPKAAEVDLRGWKVIIGGAALPRALCREALERGIDPFTGYGMSETCPIIAVAHLKPEWEGLGIDEQVEIRCRTGRPIRNMELRIVDEEMRDVPHDGVAQGEIVVRAPWLTQGYLNDPEGSERLWAGGWLHTGDIAVIGEDGYVRITDRLKDVIKTGGEWVSSIELEDLILKVPGISEVAVIGVPDPKWTERPMAVISIRDGVELDEDVVRETLRDFAARGLISRFAVPDRVVIVEELPKTSVGKLDKKRLRRMFL
ncbi:fatty acid--CoA ligase [Amaricoccus sp. W119]|uniref:fatty acid--CoA ligase n=1 Tax=Amaricoccus sp. W119 TaxID=3391833 RepID=UPI0039A51C2E